METRRDLCREAFHAVVLFAALCFMCLIFSVKAYACNNPDCPNYKTRSKELQKTDCIECLYSTWDKELKEYTMELCEEYQLSYSIVNAIIWDESRYQADAVGENANGTRDWGLMQLNDVTFDFLSVEVGIHKMEDLLDPKTGLRAGIALLNYDQQWADNDAELLMCYQMGQGAFARYKRSGGEVTDQAAYLLSQGEYFAKNCMNANQEEPETPEKKHRFRILTLRKDRLSDKLVLVWV